MVGEWNGRWSDGSKEWTPYWMKKLNHTFGDDGVFWMLYEDVLETFKYMYRTRHFDEKWTIIQQWTSCEVAWLTGYSRTKFVVDVKQAGTIVLVLAQVSQPCLYQQSRSWMTNFPQLDDRYFRGLEGEYNYELHFLLKEQGAPSSDYICRVRPVHQGKNRSVSAEVYLEPGKYEVIPKLTATRNMARNCLGFVISRAAQQNPQKLRQVGMQYDLAHAKGGITDEDQKLVEHRQAMKHRRKRRRYGRVKMNMEIDIARSSRSIQFEESNERKAHQEGEGEQFEDAAENLDNGDPQHVNGQDHDAIWRELAVRHKTDSGPPGEEERAESEAAGEMINPTLEERGLGDVMHFGESGESDEMKGKDIKEDQWDSHPDVSEPDALESRNSDSDNSSDCEEDGNHARWNAVCVTCLRVYSQDPDLTISLMQPETSGGEASSSLVQGQEPAGATQ